MKVKLPMRFYIDRYTHYWGIGIIGIRNGWHGPLTIQLQVGHTRMCWVPFNYKWVYRT